MPLDSNSILFGCLNLTIFKSQSKIFQRLVTFLIFIDPIHKNSTSSFVNEKLTE